MSSVSHSGRRRDWQLPRSFQEVVLIPAALLLSWAHLQWLWLLQTTVPDAYLDEVFHQPQASLYWQGHWSRWDDKITTPPGLYVYSVLFSKLFWFDDTQADVLSPYQARCTNAVLLYCLAVTCGIWMWTCGTRLTLEKWLSKVVPIFAFPLFFFFSGLYYTDVFSALTVMCAYCSWQASIRQGSIARKLTLQLLHLLFGLLALASRQTNIFWVAIYMGGLQTVYTVQQKATIRDPEISDAYLEDFVTMTVSLVTFALKNVLDLLFDLWPSIGLLLSFIAFIIWNGGVVLGDKANHMAGFHLPQMLYLWPFIMFFSWPTLLPYLANPKVLLGRLPRISLIALVMLCVLATIHFNTIVHPFLLADNRHYTFYVFKIFRINPWLWYLLVPVYTTCAWLSIMALCNTSDNGESRGKRTSFEGTVPRETSSTSGGVHRTNLTDSTNRISFLLIWTLSTSLSLITAPLVEPRYFIIPWLMWRLRIPNATMVEDTDSGRNKVPSWAQETFKLILEKTVWIEILWYMLINLVTCKLFLFNGFAWPQEPGKVQRFMW